LRIAAGVLIGAQIAERSTPLSPRRRARHSEHSRRSISQGTGIAHGDSASLLEKRLELTERIEALIGAGANILLDLIASPGDGCDLLTEDAALLSGHGGAVALQGKLILLLPSDVKFLGEHFRRFPHDHPRYGIGQAELHGRHRPEMARPKLQQSAESLPPAL